MQEVGKFLKPSNNCSNLGRSPREIEREKRIIPSVNGPPKIRIPRNVLAVMLIKIEKTNRVNIAIPQFPKSDSLALLVNSEFFMNVLIKELLCKFMLFFK